MAKQLYDLQGLDLELEERRQTLAQVETLLADEGSVREARQRLEQARGEVLLRERELRRQEGEMEALHQKLMALETKLYGGTVTNFKELQGLHQDAEFLKRKHQGQEEEVLELMEKVEEGKRLVVQLSQHLGEVEKARKVQVEELSAQRQELSQAIAALEERRARLLQRIDPAGLNLYQEVRRSRQPAVVRVEQGRCLGCRVSLSLNEIQKARRAPALCSSCGRILYPE